VFERYTLKSVVPSPFVTADQSMLDDFTGAW